MGPCAVYRHCRARCMVCIHQGTPQYPVAFTDLSHICTQNLSPNKAKMVKTFRTKPFPLFDAIGDLIDGTRATGEGVFQAGQTSVFDCHDSPTHDNSPSLVDPRIDPVLIEASRDMDKALNQVRPFRIQRHLTDCITSGQESWCIFLQLGQRF